MEFLLILQIVISGFGSIYYALQLCVSGSTKITKVSSLTGHLLAYILIWICLKVACALLSTENPYCFFDNYMDLFWTGFQSFPTFKYIAWPMSLYWVVNACNFILNFTLICGTLNIIRDEKLEADAYHFSQE